MSDYSVEWKGGAPKAMMKKRIPREKISAFIPSQGLVLAVWISGAM